MDIDWDEIQQALVVAATDEEHYLDRESGEVVSVSESEIESEPDAGDEGEHEETLREEMENDPDRFVLITPVPIADRVEWMNAFVATLKEKSLSDQLLKASNGQQPERDFDRILRRHPDERARWIAFHDKQIHEVIECWAEENDVESDTPPPWRLKPVRRRPPKRSSNAEASG